MQLFIPGSPADCHFEEHISFLIKELIICHALILVVTQLATVGTAEAPAVAAAEAVATLAAEAWKRQRPGSGDVCCRWWYQASTKAW